LVKGLSGKIRIHNFPPRLMNRVIATREASICRSVIHAASSAFRPYSPNARSPPRHALPVRRPRICFLYFTFFGINIAVFSLPCSRNLCLCRSRRFVVLLNLRSPLGHVLALIDPALHADNAIGGVSLRETEIDVCAQSLQRQSALQVPFFARDFRAVQTPGHAYLDAFATETQSRVHGLAHRA